MVTNNQAITDTTSLEDTLVLFTPCKDCWHAGAHMQRQYNKGKENLMIETLDLFVGREPSVTLWPLSLCHLQVKSPPICEKHYALTGVPWNLPSTLSEQFSWCFQREQKQQRSICWKEMRLKKKEQNRKHPFTVKHSTIHRYLIWSALYMYYMKKRLR